MMESTDREDARLEVADLTVVYKRAIPAVRGASLTVPTGCIVALLGMNGAGKTSVLRAISGFMPAEDVALEGTIQWRGKELRGKRPDEISRLGIALVPERAKIFATLTVEDNLQLAKMDNDKAKNIVLPIIRRYFPILFERRRQIAGHLSGGERQMLAIARALLSCPSLLLVDELSMGLAPLAVRELLSVLRSLNDELKLPILLVEQNAAAALAIADHVYLMEGGSIVFGGTPSELGAREGLKKAYLGTSVELGASEVKIRRGSTSKENSADQNQLEVNSLVVNFGGMRALNGVSFGVQRGEIVALVGPNGAGKTTVLNVIGGMYRPDAGQVFFEGQDITAMAMHRMAHLGLGRTFQHLELFARESVLANVQVGSHHLTAGNLFSCGLFGGARHEERRMRHWAEEVISILEIGEYSKLPVADLPYGLQKLVGLGRALCARPKLLLLDEPAAGMNPQEKASLTRLLLRIRDEMKITMLCIEHDVRLMAGLADWAVVLQYGQKIAEGSPREVVSNPAVIEAFLGRTDVATG